MVARAIALVLLAVGLAVPAHADSTDDAFITNLKTSGMDYGAPDRAIQVAKTVVCGSLSANPNTSNADLVTKVTNATSRRHSMPPTSPGPRSRPTAPSTAP